MGNFNWDPESNKAGSNPFPTLFKTFFGYSSALMLGPIARVGSEKGV